MKVEYDPLHPEVSRVLGEGPQTVGEARLEFAWLLVVTFLCLPAGVFAAAFFGLLLLLPVLLGLLLDVVAIGRRIALLALLIGKWLEQIRTRLQWPARPT